MNEETEITIIEPAPDIEKMKRADVPAIVALCEPLEQRMLEQEQLAERLAEKQKAELKSRRDAELAPWIDFVNLTDLSSLSEDEFAAMLADAKSIREAKLAEAAQKAAAPDNDKLRAFAAAIRALPVPQVSSEPLSKILAHQVNKFADWVDGKITQQ